MYKFILYVAIATTILYAKNIYAQDTVSDQEKIELLQQQKNQIQEEERQALKREVEAIDRKRNSGEITAEEARKQKEEAARKRAMNIENRLAIIDNTIALLNRGESIENTTITNDKNQVILQYKDGRYGFNVFTHTHRRYDRRTFSGLVVALGLNNVLMERQSLNDSPYTIGNSRFFELGWTWSSRVFKNTNALRLRYGFSFQFNGLSPKNNAYFVRNGDQTNLEVFPENLNKAKLRMDHLVFPLHFEFGPSKKIERKHYFRYSTLRKFKVGIGGYAGFNIGTRQKLKYNMDGERIKEKIKNNYNTNNLIYGLSAYVGVGDISLYMKYDLNPVFNNATTDQNNISLGLRFDL